VRPLEVADGLSPAVPAAPEDAGSGRTDTRPVHAGSWGWQGDAPLAEPSLDLRGTTGEEGWQRLDQLIDRAIPAGLGALEVIHGKGTGRLREYLQTRLKADRRVASFKEDEAGGATIVHLA
jgi:dsDNA-specific endonuclease/ATPase MutS2